MYRRDVREKLTQHTLIGVHRRAVWPRVIFDVVAVVAKCTGHHKLGLAVHGQRRRGHLDDRKHGEKCAAQADE